MVRTTVISQTDKAISTKKTNTWIHTWSYFSTTFHKNKAHCWWVLQWESSGTPCQALLPSAPLSFSPLSPPAYLSTHKLCPHLSSPRWGFMYTPVCLYGFLLPQLLTAESLPDLLCLDFATKKKKKKIIQSKKTLVSLRKAFRSLTPLQASFYPTAFRFLGTLNEKNKLMWSDRCDGALGLSGTW